ncbi:sensor histidine kinase [Brevundimonas sp.]|uniref:sensor histidine kinase n=1 Tax=Brevundimonas sp. TaxID=1871086 RepID=UPI0035B0DADE
MIKRRFAPLNQLPSLDGEAVEARAETAPLVAVWGLAVAAALGLSALTAGWLEADRIEPSVVPALLLQTLPGLAGVWLALNSTVTARRLMLLAFALAGVAAAAMTGGLSGPVPALVFLPLFAGMALAAPEGRSASPILPLGGALASGLAAATGLISALAIGVGAPAPTLSAVTTLILLIAGAAAIALAWSGGGQDHVAQELGEDDARALLADLPGLSVVMSASGRARTAFGSPPPGVTADALFGEGLADTAEAADRPLVQSALDRANAGEEVQVVFTPRTAPNRRVAAVIRPHDGRLIAQLWDASPQRAREARLDAARQAAEDQSAGKTRFIASMSHELRTPLNAVLGFSDIMRKRLFGPLPDRYAEYADSIHQAGGHLLDLINDVLDVSKIEADRFELSPERFDAREPVRAALDLVQLAAAQKSITIVATVADQAIEVLADRRALKQIALNLLSNAVKFTPEGGAVTLRLEAVDHELELLVADTGVGIAPGDLDRIGKPFEQAGSAGQKALGTGLGLSLVRSLAELHQGRMTVDSRLDHGTAILVRLPVVESGPAVAD